MCVSQVSTHRFLWRRIRNASSSSMRAMFIIFFTCLCTCVCVRVCVYNLSSLIAFIKSVSTMCYSRTLSLSSSVWYAAFKLFAFLRRTTVHYATFTVHCYGRQQQHQRQQQRQRHSNKNICWIAWSLQFVRDTLLNVYCCVFRTPFWMGFRSPLMSWPSC